MKKALVFLISLSLLFSACTPSGISNKPEKSVNCTFTGSQAGSMFWNVSGTYNKPSPLWTYHEKDTFSMWYYTIGNLNVCKDVIYAGGDRLTAINLKTGKELWETQLKNSSPRENANTFILYPTIYGDKIVAIGARLVVEKGFDYYFERRNVLVFERKTGKLLWKSTDIGAKLEYFDFGYPVILNNKIYIPALNGEYRASEYGYGSDLACKDEERGIWVWDLNTGKILRKIILPIPNGDLDIYGTSIRSYGTNIYITAGTSTGPLYLIAFDTLRNKVLWQTQVTDEMGACMGINLFGVNSKVVAVYQNTDPNKLHGAKEELKVFDRNTGKLLWSKKVYGDVDIALTEDKLFTQTSVDTVTCFDALSGKEIWSYKCRKLSNAGLHKYQPRFTPFLTKDVLYLVDPYVIIALKPDNGHELWDIIPPFPEMIEDVGGSWRFIPVNNGFVTLYTDLPMTGDIMLHPPIIQLWSVINGKK